MLGVALILFETSQFQLKFWKKCLSTVNYSLYWKRKLMNGKDVALFANRSIYYNCTL